MTSHPTSPKPVDLRVEIGPPTGVEVAPDLWGLFFEDINTSLDGGLNAEAVRNGDFQFTGLDHAGWHALTGWTVEGTGSVQVRGEDPLHPRNPVYVRAVGPVSLTNDGWDGVGVADGGTHRLSLWSWRVFGAGDLGASVVAADGTTLAAATLEVPDRGWHHVEADLAGTADGAGLLRIDVPDGLTVELDVVSLRPLGDDGHPLTFRPDLLAVLRDLHPSFLRFPGGCVAHGLGLANMYHWKSTVGPRHEREHLPNLWGYHQSRQIGYLELFELCEAVGATPLPVVPAGVCCQNTRGGPVALPDDEMDAYVQDVLDLVEFANGPVDTPWGARRAALGHPEPFGLRYLGVGNEDAITDDFRARYARIEDALRAAHPEVVVVGTVGPAPDGPDFEAGWAFARERRVAVVDEHAYRNPRWFHQNVDRYAAYDRAAPGVYFGEYAAKTSTVRSALAEAAYMVGMERNSDVVRLASYAPLLARVGGTQWVPDLVYFDADRVLPSASYYVQQLFAAERGTALREVTLTGADPLPVAVPTSGTVRVLSPGAEFAFTDVVLDGVALADATTTSDGEPVVLGAVDPTSAVLELTATRTAGTTGLVVQLGATGPGSFVELVAPNWTGKETVVNRYDDGIAVEDAPPLPWRSLRTGEHLPVRIELDGARVRVWVDGDLRHDYVQDLRPEHRVLAGAASRPGADGGTEHGVRLVNATDDARRATVVLPGDGDVTGSVTTLAGAGPDDGAPFEASPVAPVRTSVRGGAGAVDVPLPPWSFAVAVLRGPAA